MIKLYESKNKINEGGLNIEKRKKDLGNNYNRVYGFINSLDNSRYGVVKKHSSEIDPYSEIPSGYNKDELSREFLKYMINTPFDLSKMTYEETLFTYLIKIYGTDVLVELAVDIKKNLISESQFNLVFNNLMNKFYSLNSGMKKEVISLIDQELKSKKRFKRIIWTDDYSEEFEYYIKFPKGLKEIIDVLVNSNLVDEDDIDVLETIKSNYLELLTQKHDISKKLIRK